MSSAQGVHQLLSSTYLLLWRAPQSGQKTFFTLLGDMCPLWVREVS